MLADSNYQLLFLILKDLARENEVAMAVLLICYFRTSHHVAVIDIYDYLEPSPTLDQKALIVEALKHQ